MFQDRAMDEIHKLLPRLYRFTKIPYAQCTSPNKSRCILREELKDESTYNVCFQWGCLQPYRSQHYVGVWSLCWVKENCLLCQGTQHRYMLGNQPAAFFFLFFFAVSCRKHHSCLFYFLHSNPFNAFTSSCLAAQLSLQKSKEKVNDGLKTHTYTNNDCLVICAEKVMCIHLVL